MTAADGDLSGRVALVTGAGSGIGLGIARVLARHGAKLVLSDLDADRVSDAAGELGATALEHDVTSWVSSRRAVEDTIDRHGRIDVLVNNAGVSKSVPFHELDEAEWDRVHNVNVKGVFLTTRAVVPHMMERRSGSIISISSMVGKEAIPLFVHYSASKFAVIGLTQGLAKEMAPYDVRVNAVCPASCALRCGSRCCTSWRTTRASRATRRGRSLSIPSRLGAPRSPRTSGRPSRSWPRTARAT